MLLGGGRSTSSNNGDRRSRLQVCIIGHEPLDVLTRDLSDQKGQIYGSAPYSSGHVSYGSCGRIPVLRISTLPRFWKNVTSNNACTRIKGCYAVGNPVGLMWCHGGCRWISFESIDVWTGRISRWKYPSKKRGSEIGGVYLVLQQSLISKRDEQAEKCYYNRSVMGGGKKGIVQFHLQFSNIPSRNSARRRNRLKLNTLRGYLKCSRSFLIHARPEFTIRSRRGRTYVFHGRRGGDRKEGRSSRWLRNEIESPR